MIEHVGAETKRRGGRKEIIRTITEGDLMKMMDNVVKKINKVTASIKVIGDRRRIDTKSYLNKFYLKQLIN